MSKNILITGGCGFIGFNFVKLICKNPAYEKIIVVDNLSEGSNEKHSLLLSNWNKVSYINASIASADISKILEDFGIDEIVNFAAFSHVDESLKDPMKFIENNVLSSSRFLKSVTDYYKLKGALRFIHISTDEVFGEFKDKKHTHASKYYPTNPYSASKASFDLILNAWKNSYGLKSTISYCTNNYGPNQNKSKFIPKVINSLIEGKKIPIFGYGEEKRIWLYVEDHCKGIEKALAYKNVNNDPLMFSGGTEITNKELVIKIIEIMKKIDRQLIPGAGKDFIDYIKNRPGHDFAYSLDDKQTREKLDWRPQVSLEEGLEITIKHHLNEKN